MDEINIKDLFNYYISKLFIIGVIVVVVGIIGCLYAILFQVPMYNSYTTLVLTRVSDDKNTTTNLTNDITINSKLVSTYSEIIKSSRIMNEVIDTLALDYSVDEMNKIVTITNVKDTELIKISVDTPDASLSSDIANEIALVFSKEIADIYEISNLTIIDKAVEANDPYNINIFKQVLLYLAIGFVLALVIIFVMYYFDNKIRSVEEVEEKIGLPILGAVPNKVTKKSSSNNKGVVKK